MDYNIIDARGLLCPKPLILTKKALNDPTVTQSFTVLIDNDTAKVNVEKFLGDNNVKFNTSTIDNGFAITASKTGEAIPSNPEEYCNIEIKKETTTDHVICFKNDKMGFGPDDLGRILIKGFTNTIKEATPLPRKIIFYNSGVKIVVESSQLIESLKELEELGVEILVCGTCADYFNIKEQMAVGSISNMYDIIESLTKASKIIYP